MAKHRRADSDAQSFSWPAFAASDRPAGAAPTDRAHKPPKAGMFRRKRHDDLFERSFRMCLRCGEHVYVLASSCRNCDRETGLVPAL
jgi:ribosomal protein L40E